VSRLTDHLLRTLAAVPPSNRVLDLACGTGHHADLLARLGFDFFACEYDEARLSEARQLLADIVGEEKAQDRLIRASPGSLGFPDEFFDWVVACGAYDLAASRPELADMLAETRRVLKTGGWVFTAVDVDVLYGEPLPVGLTRLFEAEGLALAEAPVVVDEGETVLVRGIYRKVGCDTIR
jgi:SAM-dependent methyltransferase